MNSVHRHQMAQVLIGIVDRNPDEEDAVRRIKEILDEDETAVPPPACFNGMPCDREDRDCNECVHMGNEKGGE